MLKSQGPNGENRAVHLLIREEAHSGSMDAPAAEGGRTLARDAAREVALAAGFTEAGLVAIPYAAEERDAGRFAAWVGSGRAGTMQYLKRTGEDGRLTRERVRVPFPWARSALVCFASYLYPDAPLSTETRDPQSGWIARYAWTSRADAKDERRPSDYHKVLLKRLRDVEARLHAEWGEFESRCYVDTGPVVERALAVAAGLGWAGKNTCLIHPELGSWGFLAVLLTSLDVKKGAREQATPAGTNRPPGTPAGSEPAAPMLVADRCGTCRRCIEACPTHALDVPYEMDATRCISYLTIEHKGPISEELMTGIGRQVFGCDICQDVCPWNRKAQGGMTNACSPTLSANSAERMGHPPIRVDPELEPRTELIHPALDWLASLDEKSFEREFNGSPVRRAGFWGLRRNVAIAMGNSGLAQFAAKLEEWAVASDEGLRVAARWALCRLRNQTPA
jgi:epoxyqueuosine reductase